MPETEVERMPRALWTILGIAVAVRVAGALALGNTVGPLPGIFDQISYHTLATRVVDGHGFTFGTGWWPATAANQPTAHWSFLYVLFIAATYVVAGVNPIVPRLVQAVIVGLLQPLLTFRIARRLFGPRAGLISATIVAGYAYFVYYSAALLTESFYIVAILWSLDAAQRIAGAAQGSSKDPALKVWVQLGIALAVAVLLRQVILLVVPVILAWVWWRISALRSVRDEATRAAARPLIGATVVALVIAIGVAPWTVRNYRAFHRFVPLNTNAGFAFYWGNHPIHGTTFMPLYEGGASSYLEVIPQELRGLDEAALDQALLRRGFQFVIDDPARIFRLSLSRIKEYVKFWPSPDSGRLSNIARVLSFGLYLPFLIGGVVLAIRRPGGPVRTYRAPAHAGIWLLLGVSLLYSLIHVVTWTLVRYRVPVDAVMMPFAGLALARLYEHLRVGFAAPVSRSTSAPA